MNLNDLKLQNTYYNAKRGQMVQLITCDPEDGASLIVEPLDEFGDIMGGDLFRAEAYELEPVTRQMWEGCYPPEVEGNLTFEQMPGNEYTI